MYKEIGKVTKESIASYKAALKNATWKDNIFAGADFKTWFYTDEIKEFLVYYRAFFLLIPAGGAVHRHTDGKKKYKTYCIPITSNKDCINFTYPGEPTNLKVGTMYEVDRNIEHESVNNGRTSRTHLLIEVL